MHIIPVIHHITNELTFLNADICHKNNTFGVMLISMTGDNENLSSLAKIIKGRYPNLKVGINLLGVSALNSLDESLTFGLDMTWSDNPIITSDYISDDAYLIKEKISKNEHLFLQSKAAKKKSSKKRSGSEAAQFDQKTIQEFKEAFGIMDGNKDGLIDKVSFGGRTSTLCFR